MVMGAFPLAKISMLGIKHITKPVVKVVKDFAKSNRLFKRFLCVPAGQLVNYIETRSKMRMLKLPQPKRIPPLSADQATELGANLISEILVVAIGVGLIYFEISRQALKDKKKHDEHIREQMEIANNFTTLKQLVEWEENELRIINENVSEYLKRFED